MFKKIQPFFIVVETPLHAGSGSDLGIVDLPIQRERHTGFPKIESSGLKGSVREVFEELHDYKTKTWISDDRRNSLTTLSLKILEPWKEDKTRYEEAISLCFGPEGEDDAHAGALGFTDARLLLFPVKSMKGVFAWITCPFILERFKKEIDLAGVSGMPELPGENKVSTNSSLLVGDKIVLEEYTFPVSRCEISSLFSEWLADKICDQENDWKGKLKKDIVILSDDDFRDFVSLSTEVIARIKINNQTGTVQQGALFYEEYLPQESILYSLALASPIFKDKDDDKGIFTQNGKGEEDIVIEFFRKGIPEVMQIGGNATIGKGIVRIKIMETNNEK